MRAETGRIIPPEKIKQTLKIYLEGKSESAIEAITKFYGSDTYRLLEREETKLWHYGPVALYQEYVNNK